MLGSNDNESESPLAQEAVLAHLLELVGERENAAASPRSSVPETTPQSPQRGIGQSVSVSIYMLWPPFGCPHLADVKERPSERSATNRRSHNGQSAGCHRCPLCRSIWRVRLGAAMLVYRVFPYLPQAASGETGHATHDHAQGTGRLDNPNHYRIWYLAVEPAGAIAEAFGDLDEWGSAMFECPMIPGSRRAMETYLLSDCTPLLDLDDSRNLLTRGLRPTQVIERNRAATQNWALTVFNERNDRHERIWQGVRWWSYYRPQWRIIGYWGKTAPQLLTVEELALTNPAVVDASTSLGRSRERSSLADSDALAHGSSVAQQDRSSISRYTPTAARPGGRWHSELPSTAGSI